MSGFSDLVGDWSGWLVGWLVGRLVEEPTLQVRLQHGINGLVVLAGVQHKLRIKKDNKPFTIIRKYCNNSTCQ